MCDSLTCDCGKVIKLRAFTNTCPSCGTEYNAFGQELAPREQWGLDTGEEPWECDVPEYL